MDQESRIKELEAENARLKHQLITGTSGILDYLTDENGVVMKALIWESDRAVRQAGGTTPYETCFGAMFRKLFHETPPKDGHSEMPGDGPKITQEEIVAVLTGDATKDWPPMPPTQRFVHGYGQAELRAYAARVLKEVNDTEIDDTWRNLALQFDGHRMQAIYHLRMLREHNAVHHEVVDKFLSAGPLSGEEVLAQRLAKIAVDKKKYTKEDVNYWRADAVTSVINILKRYGVEEYIIGGVESLTTFSNDKPLEGVKIPTPMGNIIIQITGPQHHGVSSVSALINTYLSGLGLKVEIHTENTIATVAECDDLAKTKPTDLAYRIKKPIVIKDGAHKS